MGVINLLPELLQGRIIKASSCRENPLTGLGLDPRVRTHHSSTFVHVHPAAGACAPLGAG